MTLKWKASFIVLCAVLSLTSSRNCFADYWEKADVAFAEGNLPLAFEFLKKSADLENNPLAMRNLGVMYLKGEVADQNTALGLKYLERAMQLGDNGAYDMLGRCYAEGIGVSKNYNKAIELWTKAFENGEAGCGYNIAIVYLPERNRIPNMYECQRWLTKSAEAGSRSAQYVLGTMLIGNEWVYDKKSQNDKMAMAYKWFSLAAERGDQRAKDMVLFFKKQYGINREMQIDTDKFVSNRLAKFVEK